jgi:CheY-like chemotaxis protein
MPKKILIVEDDIDIRESLRELLELEGYPIAVAANGQEALDVLAREPLGSVGLILLDLMMPVKDGISFRVEQKADPRLAPIPVVVMSADRSAAQKVGHLGVDACLRKPVELERLLELLRSKLQE